MTCAAPVQLGFDLRLRTGRPLHALRGVMAILDRDEDDVLMLIEGGLLRFAFDLRGVKEGTAGTAQEVDRAEPRVWRGSLVEYSGHDYAALIAAGKQETERELEAVIKDILPKHRRPTLKRTEIMRAFNCSGQHIANLIEARLLLRVKNGGGVNQPDEITRESVVAFLRQRRMPR